MLAEGAFPVLGGPHHTSSAPVTAAAATAGGGGATAGGKGGVGHRVLSVDPRTKRVLVESYAGSSRRTAGHGEEGEGEREAEEERERDAEMLRVLPPPREVEYVRVQRGSATRWIDLKGGVSGGGAAAKYVAPPRKQVVQRDGKGKTNIVSGTAV